MINVIESFINLLKSKVKPSTKYDIALYGWWCHENFGGILTYFALYKILNKLGYSVVMIPEAYGQQPRYKIPANSIAMSFASRYYNCVQQPKFDELNSLNKLANTFIVGGDQLWNYYINFVKNDYFLDFVDAGKIKISYSTSFGPKNYNPPEDFIKGKPELLKRFNAVSVRENYAVEIAKNKFGVSAVSVIDAVFLIDLSDYLEVIKNNKMIFPKKYLFAFILNATSEKRQQVETIAKKLNLEIVCAPDAAVAFHKDFYKNFSGLKCINPLSMETFLAAFYNASYIVTDSFHGTCLSYIFKKPFSFYYNHQRGSDRFIALMDILKLSYRNISPNNSAEELLNNNNVGFGINWEVADKNIECEKNRSLNWLKDRLKPIKN